jgi:hypothetical protein
MEFELADAGFDHERDWYRTPLLISSDRQQAIPAGFHEILRFAQDTFLAG